MKNKIVQFSIILFTLAIISLGTIKMFEEVETQTKKTKTTIVYSILNLFEQPTALLTVIKVEAEEAPQLTTEERYFEAIRTDIGFRSYIVNMMVKRNNPGNLRCANQSNSTCENGFAVFPDTITGFRGLLMQLELDKGRGDTIRTFIEDYAPKAENNTEAYIATIVEKTGKPENTRLSALDLIQLGTIITACEHSIFY